MKNTFEISHLPHCFSLEQCKMRRSALIGAAVEFSGRAALGLAGG